LPERLLRGHVLRRSVDHPELRERRRRLLLGAARGLRDFADGHLRDAEIQDFDEVGVAVALDEHHVLRLQIAVHDPEAVSAMQRHQDLPRDVDRALRRHRPLLDLRAKILPFDVLEDEEERAVRELAEIGRRRDVRVLDVRGGHRFAFESRDHLRHPRHLLVQDLDGHALVHEQMLGAIHRTHPAQAKHLVDAITLREHLADEAFGVFLGGSIGRGRGVAHAKR
jgi:hypothetical protein